MPESRKRGEPGARQNGSRRRDSVLDQVLDEVQRRIPPDLARRLEVGITQGQKALRDNLGQARRQLEQAATRADVERLTRRLDQLTEIVEAMVSGAAQGARTAREAQRSKPAATPRGRDRSPVARPARKAAGPPSARARTRRPDAPGTEASAVPKGPARPRRKPAAEPSKTSPSE